MRRRTAAIAVCVGLLAGGGSISPALADDGSAATASAEITAVDLATGDVDLDAPGTVLGFAELPADELADGAARALGLHYVTRDQNDRPVSATGTLYLPEGDPPPGGWPIVSWAHGTVGLGDDCAPSRLRDVRSPVSEALKAGYAVTATDYAGTGSGAAAEYLGGRAAAASVIDVIRAARAEVPELSHRWVSVGHSQGGHAALWAAHRADDYGDGLDLRGTVALAPVSNIVSVFNLLRPGIPSLGRFNPLTAPALYLLAGLDDARPDLAVTDYLSDRGRELLERSRNACNSDMAGELRDVAPGELVSRKLGDGDLLDGLRDYFDVPTSGYSGPVRVVHGFSDAVVPYPLTLTLASQLRGGGVDLDLRSMRADHSAIVEDSLGETMEVINGWFGEES